MPTYERRKGALPMRVSAAEGGRKVLLVNAHGGLLAEFPRELQQRAEYIAHACNNYPRLVAALKLVTHSAIGGLDGNAQAACDDIQAHAQNVLRELGELE